MTHTPTILERLRILEEKVGNLERKVAELDDVQEWITREMKKKNE